MSRSLSSIRDTAIALLVMLVCSGCGGGGGSSDTASAVCNDQSGSRVLASVDASITVDAASDMGQAAPLIGFLHGISAPSGPDYDFPAETAARIAALQPTLWKVSTQRHYLKAKLFGAQIMYASSDEYFSYQPIYYPWNDTGTQSGTFDNWRNFDANAVGLLQSSLTQNRPVDYWGILSEPQFAQYTPSEQQLLFDTFSHGYHDFKDGHPEQKVVAPTTVLYSRGIMESLLDYAVANQLRFDAIDWHELGTRPEEVPAHVDDLRALLAARPALGAPPVIIDEYPSAEQHHLPGFAVAWFYYLEKASVLRASRACWDVMDATNGVWSNCWDGLNGLFMKDNLTPQAIYWVHERYAGMHGRKLDSVSTASTDVVALARASSVDPLVAGEIRILAGRFVNDNRVAGAPARDIAIHVQGLPASVSCVGVQVQRIPYPGPDVMSGTVPVATPLVAMETVDGYTARVIGGRISAYLPAFRDRDAYYISFR